MNATAIKQMIGRTDHVPGEHLEKDCCHVRYATNEAVQKAHRRAIQKFARMFRKLAKS